MGGLIKGSPPGSRPKATSRLCVTSRCYWLHTAHRVFERSKSSAYVALASAIEAFLSDEKGAPCDACGKPTGKGPTALFRDFLEVYTPEVPPKMRRDFYDTRSSLTHGSKLLLSDEIGWGISLTTMQEGRRYRVLSDVVRIALLN